MESILLLGYGDKKTHILLRYLETEKTRVYPASDIEEMVLLLRERRIRCVIIPHWVCDQINPARVETELSSFRKKSGGMIPVCIAVEETDRTQRCMSSWDAKLVLPAGMFDAPATGRAFSVDQNLKSKLKRNLEQFIELADRTDDNEADEGVSGIGKSGSLPVVVGRKSKAGQRGAEFFDGKYEGQILFQSAKIRELVDKAILVARSDSTVLITGESGTGKEVFADIIQHYSSRRHDPYLRVHCAGMTESLVESELFGYEKGAFTGALKQKRGYFEEATNGTLFLDEIGEIDLRVQAKLLRVLEYREIMRVGSARTITVNVRILSATNRNLWQEVRKGHFREDLYYRLSVVQLHIPPLRERQEDIPALFNAFVEHFNRKMGRNVNEISVEARRILMNYPWPGNIRELKNVIEGVLAMKTNNCIDAEDLPMRLRELGRPKIPFEKTRSDRYDLYGENIDDIPIKVGVPISEYEKRIIAANLHYCGGNRRQCARMLSMPERTLYRKLREYGLEKR